ncbi:hypothetical protein RJ639_039430 [Escallonia herrerae]|uniref:Cytochrome P450 n=1 Tax=Escallonia herrerae TaxID=1293975 RepID=A0AA88WIW0_9ASTE|nr:hypothetical protein RJ639_039430 [Escallonia herrerae]
MIDGMWSVPVNLPFTRYNRSLRASAMVGEIVKDLIREKRIEFEQKGASSHQDLITCLLSIRDKENKQVLSENEIVHSVMLVMVAGHDTSSVLITFIVRLLANNPTVFENILRGATKNDANAERAAQYVIKVLPNFVREIAKAPISFTSIWGRKEDNS